MRLSCGLPLVCIGFLWGATAACLIGVEPTMACGDGYVDRDAGEECDPKDPNREFASACESIGLPLGEAACHEQDCTIIATEEQCASCGDGHLDPQRGEQCDGSVPGGTLCLDNTAAVECTNKCRLNYDGCPLCGNGKIDPKEECDYLATLGGYLVQPKQCSEVESGFPKPFTYGEIARCRRGDCTYNRAGCSFCGDGELDAGYRANAERIILPELCDGDVAQLTALKEYCHERCTTHAVGDGLVFDCKFKCADDCRSFEDLPDEEAECCVPPGETCPVPGSEYRCCWELVPENAESGDPSCIEHMVGDKVLYVCR